MLAIPKDTDKRFEVGEKEREREIEKSFSHVFKTIAAKYVPGKSAEQCQEKFKALVAAAKVFLFPCFPPLLSFFGSKRRNLFLLRLLLLLRQVLELLPPMSGLLNSRSSWSTASKLFLQVTYRHFPLIILFYFFICFFLFCSFLICFADDPWRWDKISAGVTGKDRKQVVARYKELVERMKAKK